MPLYELYGRRLQSDTALPELRSQTGVKLGSDQGQTTFAGSSLRFERRMPGASGSNWFVISFRPDGGVLASAAWKVGAGIAAGLAGAVVATRAMRALLYGVEPLDLMTYVGVVLLVGVVVALAAWAPARRAAGIDPMTLMRAE